MRESTADDRTANRAQRMDGVNAPIGNIRRVQGNGSPVLRPEPQGTAPITAGEFAFRPATAPE
jgi:hypothetical protein